MGALPRLIHLVRRHQIDLIHINGTPVDKLYGQVAALVCRVPVVTTLHGFIPKRETILAVLKRPRLNRIMKVLSKNFYTFLGKVLDSLTVHHVIAVSDAVYEDWRAYWRSRRLQPERLSVVYSGVPVAHFSTAETQTASASFRRGLGIPRETPLLLNVSRLVPGKGQHLLIPMMREVMRTHPDARLVIIGEGDYRQTLEDSIRNASLEDHIALLGRRNDIPCMLAACDLFVFPSLKEGFGLVAIEAMAAGKPVVAFRLPPMRRLEAEGTGIVLAKNPTSSALADAVLRVLDDPHFARSIGLMGKRIIAEKYDVRYSAEQVQEIYRSVLEPQTMYRSARIVGR